MLCHQQTQCLLYDVYFLQPLLCAPKAVLPWVQRVNIVENDIDGLVQDCSHSSALAMRFLQSCTKPSKFRFNFIYLIILLKTFCSSHSIRLTMLHYACLPGWLPCKIFRTDSRLAPRQWETSLHSNAVSHWLGANLESALIFFRNPS